MKASESSQKGVVLLSGGMDSTVTAAVAKNELDEVHFLHLNYGQKTQNKELKAFYDIAKHYQITKLKVVDTTFLREIGGSSLTDDAIAVKDFGTQPHHLVDSYVPFRNTLLISLAVSYAEVHRLNYIYIGAVFEDSSGYPDCRPEYFSAMQKVIETGTQFGNIKIQTPILRLKKSEIVQLGLKLAAPFELSWSCYQSEDLACGTCDSCVLRLKGFRENGISDFIPYRI